MDSSTWLCRLLDMRLVMWWSFTIVSWNQGCWMRIARFISMLFVWWPGRVRNCALAFGSMSIYSRKVSRSTGQKCGRASKSCYRPPLINNYNMAKVPYQHDRTLFETWVAAIASWQGRTTFVSMCTRWWRSVVMKGLLKPSAKLVLMRAGLDWDSLLPSGHTRSRCLWHPMPNCSWVWKSVLMAAVMWLCEYQWGPNCGSRKRFNVSFKWPSRTTWAKSQPWWISRWHSGGTLQWGGAEHPASLRARKMLRFRQ